MFRTMTAAHFVMTGGRCVTSVLHVSRGEMAGAPPHHVFSEKNTFHSRAYFAVTSIFMTLYPVLGRFEGL